MTVTKEEMLDLLWEEPVRIGHWCGFTDLTELHNGWLRNFLWKEGEDQTLLSHRGSYKTTTVSLAIALYIVVRPNRNVLFFRKTDTDVQEIIRQIANLLKTPVFHSIVKTLYGVVLYLTKESASEISTNLATGPRGTSQLMGLGIKTSITGKHAWLICTDDIVNLKDRTSKPEREEIKALYQELENIKNQGGRFINTGTPWHKDDAISHMPNVTKVDCYSSGLMSEEEIRDRRSKMTASKFAANYELRHIAEENVLFNDPQYTQDITELYDGILHIDAAYGGSDATAWTAIKKHTDGRLTVYGKKRAKHVDECLDEIMAFKSDFKLGTTWCEDNADKGYLAKALRARGDHVRTYHEAMNKYVKISSFVKANWSNLYFLEATDPEYMEEVLDYNENAEHDDCPDSLASAIRRTTQGAKITTFQGGTL